MSAKHTPGPWVFAWGGGHALVFDAKGGPTIAAVPYDDAPDAALAAANARLIAAAPELLEALVSLTRTLNAAGYSTKQADAAIAKATGEAA